MFKQFFRVSFSTLLLLSLISCVTTREATREEFVLKYSSHTKKYCKMKLLHMPDSKEKKTKLKQCEYFRAQELYDLRHQAPNNLIVPVIL